MERSSPCCSETDRGVWVLYLPAVPFVFLLREQLFGRKLRCPRCRFKFTGENAALAIATGRCPACSSDILALPPSRPAPFERDEFLVETQDGGGRLKTALVVLTLAALPLFYLLLHLPPQWPLLLRVEAFEKLCNELLHWPLSGLIAGIFAGFLLGYLLCKIEWSIGGKFARCPHCRGGLTAELREIAVATGRCGICGELLLSDTGADDGGGAVYRLRIPKPLSDEFLWFLQALLAAGIAIGGYFQTPNSIQFIWYVFVPFEAAILIFHPPQWLRAGCRHRMPSRLVKVSGHCGTCGADLTGDKTLFQPVGKAEWLHLSDKGIGVEAATCAIGFTIFLLFSPGWVLLLTGNSGWTPGLFGLGWGGILFAGLLLRRRAVSEGVTGILFEADTVTLVGRRTLTGRGTDFSVLLLQEQVENPRKLRRLWTLKRGSDRRLVDGTALVAPRATAQRLNRMLGLLPPELPPVDENEPPVTFHPTQSESARARRQRYRRYAVIAVSCLWIALLVAGSIQEMKWLAILAGIGQLVSMLFAWLDHGIPLFRPITCTEVTFLPGGLELGEPKPGWIPSAGIDCVLVSIEKSGPNRIWSFSIRHRASSREETVTLCSDWFTEPERFAATALDWAQRFPPCSEAEPAPR